MGSYFEVELADLRTGATNLAADSGEVTAPTTRGSGACTAAGGAAGDGPPAAALGRLGGDTTSRGGTAVGDVAAGGTTLTADVEQFSRDDAEVAAAFDAWSPGQAALFTGPGAGW